MKIKMIRDYGAFKKEEVYDIDITKATQLLTSGFCVKFSSDNSSITRQNDNVKQKDVAEGNSQNPKETSDPKDKSRSKK